MATAREKRLARALESKTSVIQRGKTLAQQNKDTVALAGGALLGATGAAFVDARFNDPEDDAAIARLEKLGGVPTNGVIGAGLIVGALVGNRRKQSTLRHAALGAGLAMGVPALYGVLREKFEEIY